MRETVDAFLVPLVAYLFNSRHQAVGIVVFVLGGDNASKGTIDELEYSIGAKVGLAVSVKAIVITETQLMRLDYRELKAMTETSRLGFELVDYRVLPAQEAK